MRLFSICILVLSISFNLSSQTPSCCAHETFASLGNDTSFRNLHQLPGDFILLNPIGKEIEFDTPDGKTAKGYLLRSVNATDNWIFVFHEWWGLNDYVRNESEKLFTELKNVNVLAIDLYEGQVATTREDAQKYMQSVTKERGADIIRGASSYAGLSAKISTIGWCFGGTWSLQAAILLGEKAEACVMYYGMPETDPEILKNLEAEVLGIFGTLDQHITQEVVKKFKTAMRTAGKELELKNYNADHGFANPSNPKFVGNYAAKAWKKTLRFLKDEMDE